MTDRTVIFDVDGTLVDTNYQHALAWFRAFRAFDVTVPIWRIHRAIGMGGDRLVRHVAGEEVETRLGDQVRDAWKREFEPMLEEIVPFDGARDLLLEARKLRMRAALASSGDPAHIRHYLDVLDLGELADDWTSSQDVSETKPAPELLHTALERVGGDLAVLVGDSIWDCAAAVEAGLPCIAVRTGGFAADELREAGAFTVYDSLIELRADLEDLPFAHPAKGYSQSRALK
jgi:HAD superfamily hydrolase (TIGR01549 family)